MSEIKHLQIWLNIIFMLVFIDTTFGQDTLITDEEIAKIKAETAECERRKRLKVGVVPFRGDIYGLTKGFKDTLLAECYGLVPSIKLIEYLEKMNVELKDINDSHLWKMQKDLEMDILYHGNAYLFTEAYDYAPTPIIDAKAVEDKGLAAAIIRVIEKSEAKRNRKVERLARILDKAGGGTWLIGVIYSINPDTGERVYISKNLLIYKL